MIDVVDKATRSRMMSGIKGKNTKPEILVRKYLHGRGLRFRLHVKGLPGKPDLVFPKFKAVVFVHGCFWHQHQKCKYATKPQTRNEFWGNKLSENVKRDSYQMAALEGLGWRVIVVWECELQEGSSRLKSLLQDITKKGIDAMTLIALTPSADWDFPIFKVLANNDTGNATGHQGGIVIPKDLRHFFPGLVGTISPTQPTIDHRVKAELFVENKYLGVVSTRYQYQTWGGERSPESRLTDQLGPMRNLAKGDDVLVFQRHIDFIDHYRLTLIRKSCIDYPAIAALIGTRRWGTLTDASPISDTDLQDALNEEKENEALPFQLIDSSAGTTTSVVKKVARSLAFKTTIMELYNETCSICGQVLKSPTGLVEVDAAHVVPRALLGSDDARNGFALCKKHHWAFDNGLFGIANDRTTVVPPSVRAIAQNENLKKLAGRPILEANDASLRVHHDAFEWHRENIMIPS